MHQVKGSVAPVTTSCALPPPNSLLPSNHPSAAFSKHTVASLPDLAALSTQEASELKVAALSADETSNVFISQAMVILQE